MKKLDNDPKEEQALGRFAAVSFIKQQRQAGCPLTQCLVQAAERRWLDRKYSVATLEEWFYLYAQGGFEALKPKGRRDRGQVRSLTPQACRRLEEIRREHPKLTVRSLVRQMLAEKILQPGGFSLSSIYRHLNACGLDARRLRARETIGAGAGPQKAFESPFANDLWMTDMMHGPTLAGTGKRPVGTRLFAFIDDCSRLCPAGVYYRSESLENLLDVLRQAIKGRGIPLKIYTDNGKIFTCRHLKVVCANLDIQLLHARPYHSWSKGKVERFFRTVQSDFQQRLAFSPVSSIDELNESFRKWIETEYHKNPHSSLEGESPVGRFRKRSAHLRLAEEDLDRLFLNQAMRVVRKDATFSLNGRLWEVSPSLRGEKVEVRFDSFTYERVEIYVRGIFCQKAQPLNKILNSKSSNNYEPKH